MDGGRGQGVWPEGKLQPHEDYLSEANQPDPVLACPRQATVEVKAAAWDSGRFTAVFVAVFMGYSEYVYSLKFDSSECRIDGMTKIWNDGYAKAHIPPAA